MTLEELETELLDRMPENELEAKEWRRAVARLISAAAVPESFDEIASELPPKPRYVGPGPWLDAIRDSWDK